VAPEPPLRQYSHDLIRVGQRLLERLQTSKLAEEEGFGPSVSRKIYGGPFPRKSEVLNVEQSGLNHCFVAVGSTVRAAEDERPLSISKAARDLHHPWCDLIGVASIPCGCSDPDLPLLDAFKGAILASKTVEVAVW
jgi:hypothetical protein